MRMEPRDRDIFSHLDRYGVLSTRQIREIFFKGIANSTVLRRLRKLEKANLIGRVHGLEEGLCAWRLAPKGASLVGAKDTFRYSNRNAIEHEVTLSALRMSLESVELGSEWVTEMELKRRSFGQSRGRDRREQVIPDGIFIATHKDKPVVVAVELELNTKASNRYEKLFREYAGKDSIFQIWYFVPSHPVGRRILQEWEQACQKYAYGQRPRLGYSVLEDALKNPRDMSIHQNGTSPVAVGQLFKLQSVRETGDSLSKEVAHTVAHTVSSETATAA
ncbi:MAG TPA: replication-relaxation family protein [Bdellovibrionota bacterium]|nr:replication-relaxation family protein [Bdellovibrionota bacterium]